MTGRVLTEEELNQYERDARAMKRFPDDDLFYRFIATIRDLQQSSQANTLLWEEALAEKQREIEDRDKKLETVCEQLDTVMEFNGKLSQQNVILREALEFYADPHTWIGLSSSDSGRKARETLAKVSQKEVSTSDEPNRNAQTE